MLSKKTIKALFLVCRPRQWTKNLLIYAASFFTFSFNADYWIFSTKAFILFCMISSSVYIINDILDRESDKLHETKRLRPIASGALPVNLASVFFVLLVSSTIALSIILDPKFCLIVLAYFIVQILYCLGLKKQPILDVFCISFGFVFRALAGIVVTNTIPSHWFILSIGFLSLFLAIEKRKAELRISINRGVVTRRVLMRYSLPLLQRLESLVATSAFMTYTLWASGPSLNGAPTSWMLLSMPFVLVGIFRYQLLSDPEEFERKKAAFPNRNTEMPEEILLGDIGIKLCLSGWLFTVLTVGIANNYGLIK